MEVLFGILVFLGLIFLVVWCIKGGNVSFGILLASLWWVLVSWIGFKFASPEFILANEEAASKSLLDLIKQVYQTGLENYGADLIRVIFGTWFGAAMVYTGIVQALIKRVVELGGDKPALVAVLLNIVTAAIFTSMHGIGPIIAIGLIIIPIMTSLGISKRTTALAFNYSLVSGMMMSVLFVGSIIGIYNFDDAGNCTYTFEQYAKQFGWIAMLISLAFTCVWTVINVKKEQKVKAWAAPAAAEMKEDEQKHHVPLICLIFPVLPVILILAFGWPVIPTWLLIGFVGAICTRYIRKISDGGEFLSKCFYNGITDGAAMLAFVIILQLVTRGVEVAKPFLMIIMQAIIPNNLLVLVIALCVLAPLALFRGPLTIVGSGSGVLLAIVSLGYFDSKFLFVIFLMVTMVMNMMSCMTQSNVAWSCNYLKMNMRDYIKKSIPAGWILSVILIVAACLVFRPF